MIGKIVAAVRRFFTEPATMPELQCRHQGARPQCVCCNCTAARILARTEWTPDEIAAMRKAYGAPPSFLDPHL
ncbi:hypothetical protein D3C87_848110 [compost metagenome]